MPQWLDHAVFYEIYPQSFLDTNADGVGDFQGIIDKLDYVRDLGCDAIWMNPCFVSPFTDAGYDVADYYHTAPRYGTNEDLKRLFREAHSRGLRVLLDLVPGHTSIEHPWFKESLKPERNPYTDRYIWTNSAWEWTEMMPCLRGLSQRDGSCGTNFFSTQPALNYGFYERTKDWQQSPEDEGPRATLEAMKDVMRFWLGLGCDGFRVDMAGSLVKNDPESKGTMALWRKVRAFLDEEFPEAAIISEWGEPDKALPGGFHMDFLLHFGPSHYNELFRCETPFFSDSGRGDASAFVEKYLETCRKAGGDGLICLPSGNHDMDRLAKYVKGEQGKLAFTFLLTMPGAPFIYYGDEIGMRQVEGLTSVEGGYDRTGARTPMQWEPGVNAGFSAAAPGELYIPVDPAADRPTVQAQQADPQSLYHTVRRLLALRREHPALQSRSGIRFVSDGAPGKALAYERSGREERLLVVVNPGGQAASFPLEGSLGEAVFCLGGPAVLADGAVTAAPASAGIYPIL